VVDCLFFFSSRRRHTRSKRDWSSDVCSSDLNDRAAEADESRRVAKGKRFAHRPPTGMSTNRRTVLFVDDDLGFLEVVRNLMVKRSEERRVGKECRSTR